MWKEIIVRCLDRREELAQEAGTERPAAMSGVHVPTMIVPTTIEELPDHPSMYFVLPLWDQVVSNRVRRFGHYDTAELEILENFAPRGGAVVDIGANVGAIAVPLAAHVGSDGVVYAFEPFRMLFQYLNANVAVNGLLNVHTYHCALSNSSVPSRVQAVGPSLLDGQNAGSFRVFEDGTLNAAQRESMSNERMEDVEVRTLDSFELPRVDLIKIDVEGHAPFVLEGAVETLRKHQPLIWFEEHSKVLPEVLKRPELNYECAWVESTLPMFLCWPRGPFV